MKQGDTQFVEYRNYFEIAEQQRNHEQCTDRDPGDYLVDTFIGGEAGISCSVSCSGLHCAFLCSGVKIEFIEYPAETCICSYYVQGRNSNSGIRRLLAEPRRLGFV